MRYNAWPFYLSWGLSFAMLMAMACSDKVRRQYPTNVLFLAAFTLVFSFQIGAITSYWDTQSVMIAFIATCGVVLGCAALAFFTPLDMTKYAGYLSIAGIAFIIMLFIGIFWTRNWTFLLIGFFGSILFSAYLIYDLQLIMGGKTMSIGPTSSCMRRCPSTSTSSTSSS